jgi:hypothetical protein
MIQHANNSRFVLNFVFGFRGHNSLNHNDLKNMFNH